MSHLPDYHLSSVRKRTKGDYLSQTQWKYMFYYFDYRCCVCGSREGLQADHWVSRKRGGSSRVDNIVPMCKCCNESKSASPALGWLILKYKDIKRARKIAARVQKYFEEVT